MKSIPHVFTWHPEAGYYTDTVTPGCEWVLAGEGIGLRMYGGICVRRDDEGDWWLRRKVPAGVTALPPGFDLVEVRPDGTHVGWTPARLNRYVWRMLQDVLETGSSPAFLAGTYELCGPDVSGNPEGLEWPGLVFHTQAQRVVEPGEPLDYESLRTMLTEVIPFGGVVWHHRSGDGRMAKLRGREFG